MGARLWAYPFNTQECIDSILDLKNGYAQSVRHLRRVVTQLSARAEKMVAEYWQVAHNEVDGGESR
jgi:hypothetical protein